jgi:integral membrane sensor domain MASE1
MRPPVLAAMAAGLFVSNVLAGRPLPMNVLFVIANCGEAMLVGVLLKFWVGHPIRLDTLPQVGYFIAAVGITVTVGGSIGSPVLHWLSVAGGLGISELWQMWISARGLGMLTVTPAIVALAQMPKSRFQEAWRDGKGAMALILGILGGAYALISADFIHSDLLNLLALLVVVYPLLLWIAARREPAWTYVSLLLLTLVVVGRLGHGGGMLQGNVQVAQSFLLVSSLWALTLAVVLEQQRRAMDSAQRSERRMRHALAAGRGFTFDYDPHSDHVRRVDPDSILAPFQDESGAAFFARLLPDDRERLQKLLAQLSPHGRCTKRPMARAARTARSCGCRNGPSPSSTCRGRWRACRA